MNDFYEFLNLRIQSRRKKRLSSPVVISTRIRLARNIDRFFFSTRYSKEQKQEIYEEVKNVLSELSVFDNGISKEGYKMLRTVRNRNGSGVACFKK